MPALDSANLDYVEALYRAYLEDAYSVSPEWREYFAAFSDEVPFSANAKRELSRVGSDGNRASPAPQAPDRQRGLISDIALEARVSELVDAYRALGHRSATIDPLGIRSVQTAELDPAFYGFTDEHMGLRIRADVVFGKKPETLEDLIGKLRAAYCGTLTAEISHITERSMRQWLYRKLESFEAWILSADKQRRIFERLTDAAAFEEFVRKKFLGSKTFSLSGAESLIPLLDAAVEQAAEEGLQEIVLAMAHRGRLNVLANIIGKRRREIFREFDDPPSEPGAASGDVKYHLGYSNDYLTMSGRKIHLSLCFNPSHLEFVNPVALGRMRAKQDRVGDTERKRGMALLIHGDAGFAGEGIIQETLNLSRLKPYAIGGTLHVVINNQIGFTTSPEEGFSGVYATDPAKMLPIPIFHVNGDDPEAVIRAVALAMEFRRHFAADAIIDLVCYRRWGHNEGDEPSFTQPVLYRAIEKLKPVRDQYLERLVEKGVVAAQEATRLAARCRSQLEKELALAREESNAPEPQTLGGVWCGYNGGSARKADPVDTAVGQDRLTALLLAQTRFAGDFHPHPKIERAAELRREMAEKKHPLDWSAAEALAFASLATEGVRIRLTGQDSARGTFSHRHGVLHDIQDGHSYIPLQHLARDQAPVEIYNSPLSEAGVLGFEYGYSLDYPEGLIVWEAQFGDFVNAAQVIIDQFITSAEEKWHRLSGLVMLLPHGFEGMGPEHSSARAERFLQLCARDNIQLVNPTTPSQYFHCLRRQALRKWRKPLVILTPKSLLRHPESVSTLEQLSDGRFSPVIADAAQSSAPERVLLCSGKVYYDLRRRRAELDRKDVAIIRIEQLYPVPEPDLRSALGSYAEKIPFYWVQEEPENMGAACFWHLHFGNKFFKRYTYSVIARPASASPATGSATRHKAEQARLIDRAFGNA